MSDWLAIGLGGATFITGALTVILLANWVALRLRPPEGWGRRPSPPRPLDVALLAALPYYGSLCVGAFGAGVIVASLGAEADYAGAVVKWAKALSPLSVFICADLVWDTLTKVRARYEAFVKGEPWEPPPQRTSTRRMRGVLLLVACFAGAVWMTGLPEPVTPTFVPL